MKLLNTLFLSIALSSFVGCASQRSEFGVFAQKRSGSTEGAFLVAPFERAVGLVDTSGKTVHRWTMSRRVFTASLLRDGSLGAMMGPLKPGPNPLDGRFEIRNRANDLIWDYENADIHHDFEELPSGNFLFIAYAADTVPVKSLRGRCDRIIEVNRKRETVWEMDLTTLIPWKEITDEWKENELNAKKELVLCHTNSVRSKGHLILVSLRNIGRIAVIDREKKILVWMSPKGMFQRQHDARWLDDGRILVFNNNELINFLDLGGIRPSTVMTVDPEKNRSQIIASGPGYPLPWGTSIMSGAQLLSNGNLWVTLSLQGQMIEVDPSNRVVQRFIVHPTSIEESNTVIFRSAFYEKFPVAKTSEKISPNSCPSGQVRWDGCVSALTEGASGDVRKVQQSLAPGSCDGWSGEADFRCDKGQWELQKSVRCDWSCPCCY